MKEGFKVGLPLSRASAGGQLKLTGLALHTCSREGGTEEQAKAWTKLSLVVAVAVPNLHQGNNITTPFDICFHIQSKLYIHIHNLETMPLLISSALCL